MTNANENNLKELIIADAVASNKITAENAEKITSFSVEELKNLFWLNAKISVGHFIEKYKDYKCIVRSVYSSNFSDEQTERIKEYQKFAEYIREKDRSSGINCLRNYDYYMDMCSGYRSLTIEELFLGNINLHDSSNSTYYDLNFKIDYANRTINVLDKMHAFD